ncbi:MAG: outer membrane beta-barrel protein [Acidiferrobacter sp.]
MPKKLTLVALGLLTNLYVLPVYAHGFFVGTNLGGSEISGRGNAASAGLFVGYHLDSILGVELGYNRIGAWTGTDQGTSYTTTINNVDASLTARAWLDPHVNLFGRLGFVDWSTIGTAGGGEHRVTGSSASNDVLEELHQVFYGLGVSYRLNHHIGVRLEYRLYRAMAVNGHDLDINSLLLGATYHFSG